MRPAPEVRCKGCAFWGYFDDISGLCRRHAPLADSKTGAYPPRAGWPRTYHEDWCGEFTAIEDYLYAATPPAPDAAPTPTSPPTT